MEALILCGGLGTRLRSEVSDRPKCLALINETPFLELFTNLLFEQGVNRFVFSVGYRAEQVIEWLEIEPRPWDYSIVLEPERLGTGGAVSLARSTLSENFLIVNGDSYVGLNLKKFFDKFVSITSNLHLALYEVPDTKRYGRVEVESGKVSRFFEKGITGPGMINAGIYAVNQNFFDSEPEGKYSLENYIENRVGEEFIGWSKCEGPFIDIGTPESFEKAQSFFL